MNEDSRSVLARYVEARTPEAGRQQVAWDAVARRLASGDQGPGLPDEAVSGGGVVGAKALLVGVLVVGGIIGAILVSGPGGESTPAAVAPQPVPAAGLEPESGPPTIDASDVGPPPVPSPIATPAAPAEPTHPVEADVDSVGPRPASKRSKRKAPAAKTVEEIEPAEDASSLAREMKLLARGQRALKRGDAGEALRAFDEHARRYPQGSMKDERRVQRAQALCALGRQREARAAAAAFVRDVPGSPHAGKASRICKEDAQ